MKGFVQDIEGLAVKNTDFRRVLYTAKNCQLNDRARFGSKIGHAACW
jgi:hypothetical protein